MSDFAKVQLKLLIFLAFFGTLNLEMRPAINIRVTGYKLVLLVVLRRKPAQSAILEKADEVVTRGLNQAAKALRFPIDDHAFIETVLFGDDPSDAVGLRPTALKQAYIVHSP